MEFPFTLEIAKKYGWRNRNSEFTWFRRWLKANFDIEKNYKYDRLSQPINLADEEWDVLNWYDMSELDKNKILVLEHSPTGKTKLYFPVKNNMIRRDAKFINGLFANIKLIGNDNFVFTKGRKGFLSPTYLTVNNGIFGKTTSGGKHYYTILGVFEKKFNNFMNWNDNPLR